MKIEINHSDDNVGYQQFAQGLIAERLNWKAAYDFEAVILHKNDEYVYTSEGIDAHHEGSNGNIPTAFAVYAGLFNIVNTIRKHFRKQFGLVKLIELSVERKPNRQFIRIVFSA